MTKKKKTRAERHAEMIEVSIELANAIARTPEAVELSIRSHGRRGTWTKKDADLLRNGIIMIPMDHGPPAVYKLLSAQKINQPSQLNTDDEDNEQEET